MTPPVAVNGAATEKAPAPSVPPPAPKSVTLNARRFAQAVAFVGKFIPTRTPSPVLAGIRITSGGESVELEAFDYEISARTSVQAVGDEFTVLVSGKLLTDLAKLLVKRPIDETVTLRTEGAKLVIEYGVSAATLQTMPVQDYPELPQVPEPIALLEAGVFAAGVKRVVPAAGKDDTLRFLTGVLLEFRDFALRMVTTDRYRLAVDDLPAALSVDEERHPLVPAKTLKEIGRLFAKSESVYVHHDPGSRVDSAVYRDELVAFSDSERTITVRAIDGEFIKYGGLLPREYSAYATVATRTLIGLVEAAMPYCERATPVRLTFEPGTVMIESGSGDEAQFKQAAPATYQGETFSIAFNPNYLLDGLKCIAEGLKPSETNHVRLFFTTTHKPCVLRRADGPDAAADPAYRYLIMPIKLSG